MLSLQNRVTRLTFACAIVCLWTPQLSAQKVVLRIRPNVGDTLRMQLDQKFEMTPDPSAGEESTKPFVASVSVATRAVVTAISEGGTDLESITDSVTITPDMAALLPLFASIRKSVGGKSVNLRIAPDGAISVIGGGAKVSVPVGPIAAQMPPMLPREAVAVGDRWTRSLTMPVSATHVATGSVSATFSFDSLSQDGNNAYISMRGSFSHMHPTGDTISNDSTSGTITGTMQIDRRLGWMVDSKATINLNSTIRPATGAAPVRTRVKVSQWLRSVPR